MRTRIAGGLFVLPDKPAKTGLKPYNKTDCRGAVCFVKRVLGLEIKEIIMDNLYSHYTNPFAKIKQFCK